MSFYINPCKASVKKYGACDINSINSKCFRTCAAFEEVDSLGDMYKGKCYANCKKCLIESTRALGRDPCELRLEPAPIFNQTPHYFPALLYKTKSVGKAKEGCLSACNTSIYPNQCRENCHFDASCVVSEEGYKEWYKKKDLPSKNGDAFHDYAKVHPVAFYITFSIVSLMLAFVLFILIKVLLTNN